ncbi:MAG: ribonucleotide reductase, partial [Euryarchaeota archaeon]|nr:ribonucleotide reductase [Euryarchaeota archaeon]
MDDNNMIARTGRVQNWLDDPTDALPVSCTVINVKDSMWGKDSITESWDFCTYALQNGAGVAVHLSELRPKGTIGSTGKIASGPCAFMPIYSAINNAVKKGNRYKSGAIVLHISLGHEDILEFIQMSRDELQWVKRCVNLNQELWDQASDEVREALLKGIARGDIWLGKISYDKWGRRIFLNV